jgi:plasmid stability protein
MSDVRRATIYLDANVRRALRMKAAEIDRSVSDVVNTILRRSLLEDAEDLAAFDERAHEPNMDFGTLVKDLKRRGKL